MKCKNCNENEATKYSKYTNGEFCSKKCSKGFSTKVKRIEINEKLSKYSIGMKIIKDDSVKGFSRIKVVKYCISCGIDIKGRQIRCDDCSNFYKYEKLFQKLNVYDRNIKIANDKCLKILKEEYFKNELSLLELRKKYNIQLNTLHFYLKKNGITLRTLNESQTLSYELGKSIPHTECQKYISGWHTTWDDRQVYLRSSYEFKYAKQLDDYKIKYDVEKVRIKYFDTLEQRERISIVDFYLIELNMLVEIKSSYSLNLQNMKDRFKVYKEKGYKTKLIVDFKEIII
jgi:hypothetical protein